MTYTASAPAAAVEAWAIVIGITLVAAATTALGTVRAVRAMRARGWSELAIGWASMGLASILFGGAWLILDAYWLMRSLGRIGQGIEKRLSGGVLPGERES